MNAGIFIDGSKDNEVKAVFPGRVAYSGIVKGYGEVVIIDHGSRFFTISANLSERRKEEGDPVAQKEIIGLVGRGPSRGARLYFEIRKAEDPLEPLKWLKGFR
jgi:septal ring factor EnvC (AmiA/AmiB activator)